jgi:hypothetical protein
MWPVAFVVGFGPRQLFQHLSACRRRPTFIQPVLAPSKLHAATVSKTPDRTGGTAVLPGGETHLGLLVLRIVLPVDVARRRLVRDAERGIADLRREVVFEVEETGLAYVARLWRRSGRPPSS